MVRGIYCREYRRRKASGKICRGNMLVTLISIQHDLSFDILKMYDYLIEKLFRFGL